MKKEKYATKKQKEITNSLKKGANSFQCLCTSSEEEEGDNYDQYQFFVK